MTTNTISFEELQRENKDLRQRLEEAEGIVRAISKHEVDAFVVEQEGEEQILVLDGVDRPYRLLIERMQQGAAVLGGDGRLFYFNNRLTELLGVTPAGLAGTQFADHVAAADREPLAALLQKGRRGDVEQEVALLRNDGSTVPALLTVSPLLEPEGYICLIVTDLTLPKRHERDRKQFAAEQSARAAAEEVATVLRTADRRKDEFLATLGHELRNPLAPLRNGLQILKCQPSKDPAIQPVLDMMGRQLESLIRLVNDLLDVSRVTQGKVTLQKERTDLRLAVTQAVESCRNVIDDRRHRLELKVPAAPVFAEADLVRITQVVTNLLHNAAKFTPPAGTIWLALEAGPDEATIRVRDTGRGIAPDMLARVFDLFTQADAGVNRREGGLGIGLSLARRLVEMHGGTVEATSPGLGLGSVFIVRLPLAHPAADRAEPASQNGTAKLNGLPGSRRIVVVDDDRDSAESLAKLLQLHGHDVRLAVNGREALAILAEFVPDLLILDLGMPEMDGYELARQVRSNGHANGIRIVALSGYSGPEERRLSEAVGFNAHLVKPLDIASLRALLESL